MQSGSLNNTISCPTYKGALQLLGGTGDARREPRGPPQCMVRAVRVHDRDGRATELAFSVVTTRDSF